MIESLACIGKQRGGQMHTPVVTKLEAIVGGELTSQEVYLLLGGHIRTGYIEVTAYDLNSGRTYVFQQEFNIVKLVISSEKEELKELLRPHVGVLTAEKVVQTIDELLKIWTPID